MTAATRSRIECSASENSQAASDYREKYLQAHERHAGAHGTERRHPLFVTGLPTCLVICQIARLVARLVTQPVVHRLFRSLRSHVRDYTLCLGLPTIPGRII